MTEKDLDLITPILIFNIGQIITINSIIGEQTMI